MRKIFIILLTILFVPGALLAKGPPFGGDCVANCTLTGTTIVETVEATTISATGTASADKVRDIENIIPNHLFMDSGLDNISLRPHHGVTNPVLTKDDIIDFNATFVADPFLFYEGNLFYMFFEIMSSDGTPYLESTIGYATSPDGLDWTYQANVLDDLASAPDVWAFSYPQVFKYDGEYYMVPNSSNFNDFSPGQYEVRIYKASSFPTTWALEETLSLAGTTSSVLFADPTIFYFGGYWWVFVYDTVNFDTNVYYSTDLVGGTWLAHSGNPVISSRKAAARGAGRPIIHDNYIIMPFQDGVENYGDKVRAYKITALTPSTYTEAELTTSPWLEDSCNNQASASCTDGAANSTEQWRADGMHHVDLWFKDSGGGIAVVDGHQYQASTEWSIGIYEFSPSDKYNDNQPIYFGASKDAMLRYYSGGNLFDIDLKTYGANTGLRVKTDGNSNALYIPGATGHVGIGTSTTAGQLNVVADNNTIGLYLETVKTDTAFLGANTYTMADSSTQPGFNIVALNGAIQGVASSGEANLIAGVFNLGGSGTLGSISGYASTAYFVSFTNPFTIAETYQFEAKLGSHNIDDQHHVLTEYSGFRTGSSNIGSGGGTLSGTDWSHFYAEDFGAFGGTVTNVYGLYIEDQTYGASNFGIVLAGGEDGIYFEGITGPSIKGTATALTLSKSTMVTPTAAQTIAGAETIAADSCGTIKEITSDGDVTTNITNTFTAPAAGNDGCEMAVINTGEFEITLDANANFVTSDGADLTSNIILEPTDTITVASTGASGQWYITVPDRIIRRHKFLTSDFGKGGTAPTVTYTESPFVSYCWTVGDDAHHSFEIPHDWIPGTALEFELHWYSDTNESKQIAWTLGWNAVSENNSEAINGGDTAVVDAGDFATPTQWYIQEQGLGSVAGSNFAIDDMIGLDLKLIQPDAGAGSNPTNDATCTLGIELEFYADRNYAP